MTDETTPARPLSVRCRAGNLAPTLWTSIHDAEGFAFQRTLAARIRERDTSEPILRELTATDAETAAGVQAALRRLLGVAPEPVDAEERAGWPVGMAPVLRVVR